MYSQSTLIIKASMRKCIQEQTARLQDPKTINKMNQALYAHMNNKRKRKKNQ
jgi:hypothetical protein